MATAHPPRVRLVVLARPLTVFVRPSLRPSPHRPVKEDSQAAPVYHSGLPSWHRGMKSSCPSTSGRIVNQLNVFFLRK
jgi:hypothetical protein